MKKWRCTVCNYIHEGPKPPEVCPVCGVTSEFFEEVQEEASPAGGAASPPVVPVVTQAGGKIKEALFKLTYGLYVVSSKDAENKINGQICNTVFQITSEPRRIALGINRSNHTHGYISQTGALAVSVLGTANMDMVKHFGFQSGRSVDKFSGIEYSLSPVTGCPILTQGIAYLDCRIIPEFTANLGTHTLFIADIIEGNILGENSPLTYDYYRTNRTR
ncbi:MAG: flavin reductase [Syntrophomonadaceae bacterium]|jgi:flavin reductase (DIM6/NTAB) family NADH-FMN oxidoreductase RutF/rubredoxin|nr:flavin reductase [Syntrophomonadaceae bacterium]